MVTPERQVLEKECVYVNLPAHDGQLGVEHNRAPLLVALGSGRLRLDLAPAPGGGGGSETYRVSGGFAQVVENRVTILTDEAEAI